MRKNLEKRLIWVVAATLSLNGTPFTSKAYAQLSPPTSEQFKAPSPETTLAEAEARDEDTNEIPAPSSLAAENTLQKADGSEEESVLKADSQEDFRNQETPANLESEIAKGLSNAFGQEYMVTIPTPEIAAGITREVMANGGLPVVADNKVPFSYSGVNGEAGTGVAVRGFDGSILGVELTKNAEETDVAEEVSPEQRLASWKESISGKYPEEKVEFSQFGPGMNPPAGYTLVDTFYYGADRGGVYALVKIQDRDTRDLAGNLEAWKMNMLAKDPTVEFFTYENGQNPPEGYDWIGGFTNSIDGYSIHAGIRIKEPSDDISARYESWRLSIQKQNPTAEFFKLELGQPLPDGFKWLDAFVFDNRISINAGIKIINSDDINIRYENWTKDVLQNNSSAAFIKVFFGENPPEGYTVISKFEFTENRLTVYAVVEIPVEQRLASWKESISGKYPEEKVEFSQFGPGMNPPAGYTLVDTFYYGADRGGVYALVKIQEPGDDVNKRFEEWKSSVLNDYPNAVFVDVRAGQNPPDGFDWFSKFELRANEVIVYAGTPKFMIDGGGKRLPEDLNRDGIVDTKDDAYAVEISDNNKDGVVDGKDSAYTAQDSNMDGVVDGKDAAYTAQDSNMDGVVDGKDAAYTAQDSNMDGAVDSRDAALIAPDSNKVGIIDINDVSSPVTNETPFEYPVGPASPYVNTQASDPDYTPIVVIPEERPIESGEDSSLQAKTEKNISEKSQAAESSYAALALPESVPVENVPQDKGMMTLEEAVKRNDGFIKDIDPKNPSQSTCEGGGGTQIKSPGGVGPTAWFCDGSPAPKSSGPAAADFAPAEKTVVSTENSPEPVKPEIEIDTASNSKPLLNKDGSVWARPVVFKNPSTEVAADASSLEIRSLTPSLNQKEEEAVRVTLNTPVVASFVRAVQSFQREYKPRSTTFPALAAEIKAAYRDVKAIVSEEAEKRIEEAKAEAENKVQDVRAAFDNAKESARASALPERNEGRSAVQSKKEKREALRETIVLIKRKADARIAEFSNLYQSADKLIKEYKQAYTAGTPFPAMTASENSTVFTTENGESLLG